MNIISKSIISFLVAVLGIASLFCLIVLIKEFIIFTAGILNVTQIQVGLGLTIVVVASFITYELLNMTIWRTKE